MPMNEWGLDKTYPLPETAAARAYFEAGHVPGKVVITPNPVSRDVD